MRRTRHNKNLNFTGLLLLAVFVSLYLVQLVCNLPHLAERLQPVASTPAHHHSAGHGGHSHKHETSSEHHGKEHAHHEEKHPASSTEDSSCCSDLAYAPFLKSAPPVELPSLVKASYTFMDSLYQAVLRAFYKNCVTAVSHAPPDPPVPKIPDIIIFLHSLVI